MSWLVMIVVGFVVGLIARAIMPGDQKLSLVMTAILGIAGSVVANILGSVVGLYKMGDGPGWIASIVGALIVMFIYKKVMAAKKTGSGPV